MLYELNIIIKLLFDTYISIFKVNEMKDDMYALWLIWKNLIDVATRMPPKATLFLNQTSLNSYKSYSKYAHVVYPI